MGLTPLAPRTRLVAITSGHAFGHRVLRRFAAAEIRPDMLIITVQQNPARIAVERGLLAHVGRWRGMVRARWRGWRRWWRLAKSITFVESLADDRLHQVLVRARPDVLVLAGTGIVPSKLLSIPSVATLNAHPGLLPWVRGVCPLEHSLLRGVALGATVHAVDHGIDTGPIIRRVLLPVGDGTADRISLSRRLDERAVETLADVVGAALRGEPLRLHPQSSRHPYGGWVTDAEREKAIHLIAKGEARRLYQRWHDAAGGDVLPDDDARLPS
jgi:folate-dependent phosphoribosylglycinamide formyltransferase PurN